MRKSDAAKPFFAMTSRRLILSVALAVTLVMVAGCGAGTSTSGGGSGHAESSPSESSAVGSTAPSREFMKNGSENKWATFGVVASDHEREAASKVLEENLRARQAGEWKAQCSSLTRKAMRELAPKPGTGALLGACANVLKSIAEPLKASAKARQNTLRGEIDVLRVKGDRAVALFHGSGGKDYGMSLEKEDGDWKVAAVLTAEVD